ncbi:MAG: hypothetical protein WCO44_11315 [Bacteroidota bacterium]
MKDYVMTSDWIDRYNESDLTVVQKKHFQKKMHDDPLLREEVLLDAKINQLLGDEDVLELMDRVRRVSARARQRSRLMKRLLMAASVVCLMATGAIVYFLEKGPGPPVANMMQQARAPVNQAYQKSIPGSMAGEKGRVQDLSETIPAGRMPLLASNYRPLAEFELLAGSVTRSTQLKLVEPAMNLTVGIGVPVRFKWIASGDHSLFTVILMNNRGKVVSESPSVGGDQFLLKTLGLPGGLYYWKIVQDDEWVMIGKLTLR